jgi:hypothetical protein
MAPRDIEASEAEADTAFERRLLESAKHDLLPGAASHAAWEQFAGNAGRMIQTAPSPQPGTWSWNPFRHSAWGAGVKWLVVGAVAGSAVTAAWLGSREETSPGVSRPPAVGSPLPPTTVAQPSPSPASAAQAKAGAATASRNEGAPRVEDRAARKVIGTRAHADDGRRATTRPTIASAAPAGSVDDAASASALQAEVAALDAVRTALAIGAYDRALRLVDDYHREFPEGQLAPDAEARAIEALHAQGDRIALTRRAERFLRRYPNDPHADRVRVLSR